MDNRPIGVFDSGLGGLTTVRELRRLLPEEDIVYFGDTGRVPYGTRSRETIQKYAGQDIRFLLSKNVKMVVVACNTAAAAVADDIGGYGVPYAEALTPAVQAAAERTRNGVIGVIGTAATIRSGAYERALKEARPGLTVIAAACPLFVPLVENGFSGRDNPVAKLVAEQYLSPLRETGLDTLILGCTHYPVMREVIASVLKERVSLVDSGQEAARAASEKLASLDMLNGEGKAGTCTYYVSDSPSDFSASAAAILGEAVLESAIQIDIEMY